MHYLLLLLWIAFHISIQTIKFDIGHWQQITQVRLIVPDVEIIAPVTRFPLGKETWEIDAWETEVGHFEGTAWIGINGNIVLGGHVEYPDGTPAIFARLSEISLGDRVLLRIGGMEKRYDVTEIRLVEAHDLSILYPADEDRLTLITCDEASYDPDRKTYGKRLVVTASLAHKET
jgi:LPXTG-site transpeptidase (sortase) family protein